ncbi:PilZ domain-containing protein [Pseudorhizobium endolithicum]|uniref:PilZ domain-containing protein n=1 Tax=Pseudorhizobium endolithicum TaxID=1191678 RepID=A0ABM8PT25_9HYPH|nr:PilZ domain-containing protein [Pseudorhizobium endolithicum]CAD6416622.1 PilZ domain-containing protein [Rhizobium sp. Q54]CAD7046858.1 PilZ domain-containing protein [Pseudorhizobium endolithicum]
MAQNNLGMTNRAAARTKTRIYGTVKYFNQSAKGRVVDLSATGIALELQEAFGAADGSRVKIESEELGFMEGTVRWCRGSRIGIQLHLNTNALAQVSSYFRFFHKDVRPVLAR